MPFSAVTSSPGGGAPRAFFAFPAVSSFVSALLLGCVPAGNSTPSDAGAKPAAAQAPAARPQPPANVLTSIFEDNFERAARPNALPTNRSEADSGREGGAHEAGKSDKGDKADKADAAIGPELGPNWRQSNTDVWHIENGRLCGQGARNHGVWMTRAIPVNARIEFDAISDSPDGDLKAEVWGDGQSGATAISYNNATSYLPIFGGWKNTLHALARQNEHGKDRKEIHIDKTSDDPRERPVVAGQIYHFKIERTDGKTVRWFVDGLEMASFADDAPLAGPGHEYFGFNDWEVKVCFDNVKVTPLP
ncbi:hypothetical protein [Pendulispora albinea]|uniref:Uncharacterized protein n=1 Tax=Pendulispora albinea TaxID=2741071 RepID=A0ABZ2M0N9_9BACT